MYTTLYSCNRRGLCCSERILNFINTLVLLWSTDRYCEYKHWQNCDTDENHGSECESRERMKRATKALVWIAQFVLHVCMWVIGWVPASAHPFSIVAPHRPIVSADAKRWCMLWASVYVNTGVAIQLTRSVGRLATQVDGIVIQCNFVQQHCCRKSVDAQWRSICDSCGSKVLKFRFARLHTCRNTTNVQFRSTYDSLGLCSSTITLCAATQVSRNYRRRRWPICKTRAV